MKLRRLDSYIKIIHVSSWKSSESRHFNETSTTENINSRQLDQLSLTLSGSRLLTKSLPNIQDVNKIIRVNHSTMMNLLLKNSVAVPDFTVFGGHWGGGEGRGRAGIIFRRSLLWQFWNYKPGGELSAGFWFGAADPCPPPPPPGTATAFFIKQILSHQNLMIHPRISFFSFSGLQLFLMSKFFSNLNFGRHYSVVKPTVLALWTSN